MDTLNTVKVKVSPKKLETGLRTISAGIPYTLRLRIQDIGFLTLWILLYLNPLRLQGLRSILPACQELGSLQISGRGVLLSCVFGA